MSEPSHESAQQRARENEPSRFRLIVNRYSSLAFLLLDAASFFLPREALLARIIFHKRENNLTIPFSYGAPNIIVPKKKERNRNYWVSGARTAEHSLVGQIAFCQK